MGPAASVQNSALAWSADHRLHHARTDSDSDPYDIRRGFWWAHVGWVLHSDEGGKESMMHVEVDRQTDDAALEQLQKDLARILHDVRVAVADWQAMRSCMLDCIEGLETAEKQLGWSARSGKIVLRIALQRLKRHYDDLKGVDQMIG